MPAPSRFASALLHWNDTVNDRPMPWKGETNPYRIWLSEVILQQTRVEQGWGYYPRFIAAFPTVQDLAAAPEQEVFKLWEGLGYYARCRNLIATSRIITEEQGGVFPDSYAGLLSLKGIGPYTAAAIASFAYNLDHAVVDGNVYRVLSRIFGCALPIDSTEGKKYFAARAEELLPRGAARAYNQALMDFGATLCKPVPECARCFFQKHCTAYLSGQQQQLPVKAKKIPVRERYFHYVVLQAGDRLAVREREGRDVWQHLWEPLLLEAEAPQEKGGLLLRLQQEYGLDPRDYEVESADARSRQRLSHQLIHFYFVHLRLRRKTDLPGFRWIALNELHQYPFPKTPGDFLRKNL